MKIYVGYKNAVAVILCLILLGGIFSGCVGQLDQAQSIEIDWDMDAKMVNNDGSLIWNGTVTILGNIDQKVSNSRMHLNIEFSPNFTYQFGESESGYIIACEDTGVFPYFVSSTYTYDEINSEPTFCCFALDPDSNMAIFYWVDQPEQYLVASCGQDVAPNAVLEHFEYFIQVHCAT